MEGDALPLDDNIFDVTEISEKDRYWTIVQDNPYDFNSWTFLIQLVEREGDLDETNRVYDSFLGEFPLCYVYWKKYADHEANRGNIERAVEIYERGIAGIPHSVDLWTHYCTYFAEKFENLDEIRGLWERGAALVGSDFVAHTFWDKYIEFELSQEDYTRVSMLYNRILYVPLDQLVPYYERFKVYAANRALTELANEEELVILQEEKDTHTKNLADLTAKKGSETIEPAEMQAAGIKNGEEVEQEFRVKLMSSREAIFKHTLEEASKRRPFEHTILKRPYFHVKPLDDSIVASWRKYLAFEEAVGDHARIIKLFERCLIACCYYSEFWLKYAKWLEENRSTEEARSVYYRVSTFFLRRRPDIHLAYAVFEEASGNDVPRVRQIYENLVSILPGHLESILHFVGFERRQKNYEAACAIFDTALSITSLDSGSGPFITMHYARFLDKVLNDPARAREVFNKGVQKFPESKNLWLAFVQFETSQMGRDSDVNVEANVQAVYTRAVSDDSKLAPAAKLELWLNNLEFCADWSSDIRSYRKLCEAFHAVYPTAKSHNKKRPLETTDSSAFQQNKHARTALFPTPTLPVASPNSYNYYSQYYPSPAVNNYTGYNQYGYDPQAYSYAYPYNYSA